MASIAEELGKIYKSELGRPPDPNGVKFYFDHVQKGNMTLEQVRNDIRNSNEGVYYRASGKANKTAQTPTNDGTSNSVTEATETTTQSGNDPLFFGDIFNKSMQAFDLGLETTAKAAGPTAYEQEAAAALAQAGQPNEAMLTSMGLLGQLQIPNALTQQATNTLGGIDPFNSYVNEAAATARDAGTSPDITTSISQLSGNSPYLGEAAGMYGNSVTDAAIQRSMNNYLNPYQNQVVDNLVTRIRNQRDEQLNAVRGQAAMSGAYGGARQGLVESQIYENQAITENEAITNVLQQGFDRAASLGQGQQQLQQGAASGTLGVATQDLARQREYSLAAMNQQRQRLAASQLLAQLGQTGASQQIQLGTALGGLGSDITSQELARASSLGQMGLGQAGVSRQAAESLSALGSNVGGRALSSGNSLINAALQGQQLGFNALNQQMLAGLTAQQQEQGVLDQASGQFDQYLNDLNNSLGEANSVVQGNPLQGSGTTTNTTTTNPGLYDYLALGSGIAARGVSGK